MRGVLLVALLLVAGCPQSGSTRTPREPEACERMGDRCQLPDGPIGICSDTTQPCDDPPCLACMSQH